MRKLILWLGIGLLSATSSAFSQTQTTPTPDDQNLQLAREGCLKPIGFLPTPSKVMCILTATGQSEKEVKPKTVALVFTVCTGHTMQPLPAGSVPKKYATLADCLKDTTAVNIINKELTAQNLAQIKVVNQNVLAPATTTSK